MLSALHRFYRAFYENIEAIRHLYLCLGNLGTVASLFVELLGDAVRARQGMVRVLRSRHPFTPSYITRDLALASFSGRLVGRDPFMFNRYVEHVVRLLKNEELQKDRTFCVTALDFLEVAITVAHGAASFIEWDSGSSFCSETSVLA
jgi:hypothetical protein